MDFEKIPQWLELLLATTFFMACEIHKNKYKKECIKFCVDCMDDPFCTHCVPIHDGHNIVQIRRSPYGECIRVDDVEDHLDLTGVQGFMVNRGKVIFLNKRGRCVSQTKANKHGDAIRNNLIKGPTTECITCERTLAEPFCFCSIECKLQCINKDETGTFTLSVKKDREDKREKSDDDEEEKTKEVAEELPKDDEEEALASKPSKEKGKEVEEGTSSKLDDDNNKPAIPPARPVNYNSRKRKGIPRRAPFF